MDKDKIIIKFWGVRGSIPTPLESSDIYNKLMKTLILAQEVELDNEEKINNFLNNLPFSIKGNYGGNTPCVSIEVNDFLLIFDFGSGIRKLGYEIMNNKKFQNGGEIHLFISHTHWDHIQGLPFFPPLYDKKFKLIFYSPFPDIKERLEFQQKFEFFPVNFFDTPSQKEFIILEKDKIINFNSNLKVSHHSLIHPGGSFGYKVSFNNKSVVYATDTEFYKIDAKFIDEITKIWNNIDVLIFDAQYTPEEYIYKINWGHSSTFLAVDVALSINAKKLVLFHYDPVYDDYFIENSLKRANEYLNFVASNSKLEVIASYEGLSIEI